MAPLPVVTHVGPDRTARGGISSVLTSLADAGRFPGYDVRFLATVGDASGLLASVRGVLKAAAIALASVFRRRGIYQLHMASRGSFYRKALIALVATARGHAVIIHLHGAQFHHFAADSGPVTRRLIRHVFDSADAVLVLSPEWASRVAEFSGRRDAVTVPNPVRVPDEPSSGTRDQVVYLGRLGERKGTPELIDAIELLQLRGHELTDWMIAGDGDTAVYRQRVDALPFPERVSLPGWLSRSEVDEILGHATVFCLPSYDEGKPIALLEAMSYGLACVATPVGGIPDVLKDGLNGILVPPGDPDVLAERLNRCLEDRDLRARLGAAARQTVLNGYSVEAVSASLVQVYSRVWMADR